MALEFNLKISKRNLENKGALKKLRKEGNVPGIYYSHNSNASIPFYIERKMLKEAYKSGARIFNINVGDKKRTVIFKAVDYHPVTDKIIHVDLYGVKMDQVVTVNVSINLLGTAKGTIEGGILVAGRTEIEVECLPMNIPENFEMDVSELEIGDVLRVRDILVNKDIAIKSSPEQIVASVTHQMKEEEIKIEVEEEEEEEFLEEGDEEGVDDDTEIDDTDKQENKQK